MTGCKIVANIKRQMRAIPQLKTKDILERINALQASSPFYLDLNRVGASTQSWMEIKRDIEKMFKVDACSAWELSGALKGLTSDWEGVNSAFGKSLALGSTETIRMNWAINSLNLGMFSAGQKLYEAVGDPNPNFVNVMLGVGMNLGAVQRTTRFVERAREMNIMTDANDTENVKIAHEILRGAGISDEQIAQHLDVAGVVLRKHNIRPNISARVAAAEGFFHGVTYAFAVPVSAEEAFAMNVELAIGEEEAGVHKDIAFDVVFQATAA